ncbi:Stomatin-like protein 1 [Bulinus truncatus]|nr:Stomatin-like protein 1 [Bulinus truncatus]
MASSKYSPLPNTDRDDGVTLDFSSIFTYNRNTTDYRPLSFQSVFTYDKGCELESSKFQGKQSSSQLTTDKFARYFVLFGYFVMFLVTFPVIIWFTLKKISENERLVVFRLGHLHKSKGPGIVMVFPLIDKYHKVNVSLKAFNVPPKQVITADKSIIEVGADIYFQIIDPEKSVTCVQNLDLSTRILVQTALCNILVQKTLSEIEAERIKIANSVMVSSNKTCNNWGVTITKTELSHIKVLRKPLPKKPAQLCMWPGLFDSGNTSGDLPLKFAQIAQNFALDQNSDKTEAVVNLLQTVVSSLIPGDSPLQKKDGIDFADLILHNKEQHNKEQCDDCDQQTSPSTSVNSDPEKMLLLIQEVLSDNLVQKVGETFQIEISGSGAGTYYLDLKHDQGYVGYGPDPSGDPAAILHLNFADLQAMLTGELKPFQAYMSGRLKVSGDTNAALKLEELGARIKQLINKEILVI